MCAIAGMIGLDVTESIIEAMKTTMERRGPDAWGVYQHQNATLLHARLAIIDPEKGVQPMQLSWNQEDYVLVYNGELYNTRELRQELMALGHTFRGHSDTEVVIHAYAQWNWQCVNRFNGIFAFGVWEKRKQKLFLARDRIGVKPLFYKLHDGGLLFASEMKTILAYPTVEAHLDALGARQLLLLGPGRLPGSGVFRDILELEPGCCGWLENGKFQWIRYWKLTDRDHRDSFEETVESVQYLVTDAIRRQMISDVPIGTFLSGGLDSSIITAICAREMAERGETLPTFSVDYLNNHHYFQSNKFQPDSDNAYIRTMQEHCDSEHHWTVLSPEDLVLHLEEATIARDLPGMADVDFSLLAFCKQIRQNVKVALSGECADEIFGGYPWYRDPEIRAQEGFPWAQNTSQRMALLAPALQRDSHSFVMDAYLDTCRESDILPDNSPEEKRMKQMMNLNSRWFMQTLLDRKDRMSMYTSLEVRVPFCDYRIAEYLYAVPWQWKDFQNREKGLLRLAVKDLLPPQILYRKKSPYPKTFDPAYEMKIHGLLQSLLADTQSSVWHLIQRDVLMDAIQAEAPWPWYGQLMRRPQMMAYFLQLDFWLRHYRVQLDF